ncbi:hypothetical protein Tco_0491408 [Tanacetum coccineum]
MSSTSSAVTYTSVYTDSELGRVFWGADEELSDGGPEHLPSPDYVPDPEHPPLPVEVPYVPEPEYPEYLVPSDAEVPLEDQPLPIDASPTALSPGYVADFDPKEDPKEDLEEDHADYPADGGDDDDEPSDDDDDDNDIDDEDEETFEDKDDDEEEEHLALADSSAVPIVHPVPSAGDTETFETDESAPTPRSPQIRIPFAQTRLRRAGKSVRLELHMSPSMEARIAVYATAPAPPSPPPSPLSPWSPPLSQIPLPPLPPSPSALHLAPPVPTSLPLPSSPLLPLPVSLFIPPPVRAVGDIPQVPLVLLDLLEVIEWIMGLSALRMPRSDVEEPRRSAKALGMFRTHTQMHDYRIASQESLMTTLIAHVSLLQGHLSAALGQIQALQARDQTRTDDHEGAGSSA